MHNDIISGSSEELNYIQLSLYFILYSSWLLPGPLLPGAS